MTLVGIDLGTTNTVVGIVKGGHAAAIADEAGDRLIPSVVSFHPNGSVLVGKTAKERRLVDAANTVYSVKRLIGRSWDSEEVKKARERFPFEMREGPGQAALVVARGQSYTLPEISAFVLRRAKTVAEAALGEPVEKAVITVPANFNDLQRAATKVAGRVAGLEVMRILNEPTAAALAYGYGRGTTERIAVYDFGGGTFDVTLLDLSENVFEVLATAGNTFLGGDDINLILADRMATAFLQRHKYDPRTDGQAFERLRVAAEDLKIRLSRDEDVTLKVAEVAYGSGGKPLDFDFRMTRNEFDQIVAGIVERTFEVCRDALGVARLTAGDFDQILLVGGSTRIPLVRQRVEEFFRRPVLGHISPDEVVAIGAAIQAAALTGPERRREMPVPPQPVSRGLRPPIARKGGTLPPGAVPPSSPASAEPGTEPYGQRGRMPTNPGLNAESDMRRLPIGAAQRVVAPVPGTEPPGTVAGLGARGRTPTGSGLGPEAAKARTQASTLSSAGDAAEHARRVTSPMGSGPGHVMMPEVGEVAAPGLEDPTHEAGHIASFLARYASSPQKPRTTQPGGTQPAAPAPPPGTQAAKPKEESIAFQLGDDDIQYDDPSAMRAPDTAALRRMAGPASTDEVTEVHRRWPAPRSSSVDEQSLPMPSIPDDEDRTMDPTIDRTMDTATEPQAQAPKPGPLGIPGPSGTQGMPQMPHMPPAFTGKRTMPGGVSPGSLGIPTSPTPVLTPHLPTVQGPFGQQSTVMSPSLGVPTAQMPQTTSESIAAALAGAGAGAAVAGVSGTMGMPGMPAGAPQAPPPGAMGTQAMPGAAPAAPHAWGHALGAPAAYAGAPAPVIEQMPQGPQAPLLVDVTPLTLVVETVQGWCDPIISRNTPVPSERSRTFVTAVDNQTTVRVRIAQGESKAFRENTLLGEVELGNLRPGPRGSVKIDVTFALDTDGILNVRATDVGTGQEARVTVRLVAVPEMGQVDAMAARHAAMPMMS